MAKPELGTKRLCSGCGSKYYDLNRDPIICPKCGAVFEIVAAQAKPEKTVPKPKPAEEESETEVEAETEDAELVPLEEADGEAGDASDDDDDGEDIPEIPDDDLDVDVDDDDSDDDAFLEDEEDDNVTDIIPDVGKDDEER